MPSREIEVDANGHEDSLVRDYVVRECVWSDQFFTALAPCQPTEGSQGQITRLICRYPFQGALPSVGRVPPPIPDAACWAPMMPVTVVSS